MDFFSNMATQESLIIIAFLMIAFLIGFVTSTFWAATKAAAVRKEMDALSFQLREANEKEREATEKYTIREADVKKLSLEVERTQRAFRESETKAEQWHDELTAMSMEMEKVDGRSIQAEVQVDTLSKTISNQQRELDRTYKMVEDEREKSEELRKRLGSIDENIVVNLQQELTSLRYVNALLEQERDDLQKTLNEASDSLEMLMQQREQQEENKRVYVISKPEKDENAIILSQKEALKELDNLIGEVLPYADETERDDLKLISGIGPFIEEKLNAVGIYTYEQISMFDEEFVNVLTAAIGFFPDRIKRGRWIEQAKGLWEEKEQLKLSLPHRDPDTEVPTYG